MLAVDSGSGLPLQGLFWTSVAFFGFLLVVYLLGVVLIDVFDRDDLTTVDRVGWTVLVFVVPLLGALAYLVTRSRDAGELDLLHPLRNRPPRTHTGTRSRSASGDGVYR
ncbi:MAG: PLDc N-terminal domain-containing protein [Blastococcus sp.]